MADIAGQPMIWHVVNRLRGAKFLDDVIVATSVMAQDDVLADFCDRNRIGCYRGSESDVLDRYYQAATGCASEAVVRITADCPLIDPRVVDEVITVFLRGEYDYVTNALRYTFPDGLDTEVFSMAALERAWKEARTPADREHVTSYIQSSGQFRIANVENAIDLSALNLRWTVDEYADLEFVRAIFSRLGSKSGTFGLSDVLQLLDKEPDLMTVNQGLIRNEGYYKSLANGVAVDPRPTKIDLSLALKAKSEKLIPSGTQTFSKGPTQFVQGVAPVFLARGQGSHVWDVDGNEYIDYPLALGPIILGHNYPAVTEAVIRQVKEGTSFSLPHPLEIEVAEMLVDMIPCAEMVRFGKNGSDATAGAVRAARAYTQRDVIACSGYHGWQDWYIGSTTRNKGVPKAVQDLTVRFQYNDISSLERVFSEYPGKVAAVIMEPVGVDQPKNDFLQNVRNLTLREGTVLIFDEVITGFRLALGGAQEYFGVTPDLACFGKAMGNGYPISAVVGRKELMQLFDEVFFSFTFGGEAVSLAATLTTLRELREKKVIPYIWEQGQKLKDGYNVISKELGVDRYTECIGYPPHSVMILRDSTGEESLIVNSLFQQEVLKRGILSGAYHNVCFSHSEGDIEYTLRVYRDALAKIKLAAEDGNFAAYLEGKPIQPIFRQR
jgi:glutamate-1-semialdehyde 2,1-aminomutase/spore coat polysaccharide biosynthesis protein SpsF